MKRHAFTLVELLVVIAIIGLLSSIAVVSMNSSRVKARDLKRKTDLKQLATAVELYYAKYDRYPDTSGAWWTTCVSVSWTGGKGITGGNGWIPDLAPEFIGQLPLDPVRGAGTGALTGPTGATNTQQFCYVYASNGTNYKIASHCSAESGPAGSTDPFYKGSAAWSCGDYHFAVFTPGAYGW